MARTEDEVEVEMMAPNFLELLLVGVELLSPAGAPTPAALVYIIRVTWSRAVMMWTPRPNP